MPGTVLLLAAAPAGKGCLVDAASVLPVLAAVPPAVLAGTETANVVELADPLEPQAVLTRLRAAAGAPGPLTVFVAGQLQLDRRQRLPHLALARTTPATVRYTGFPWAWFKEELRLRPPGSTTLFLDLHADPETWEWLGANPLDSGYTSAVYGRIVPPSGRRGVAVPTYMKTVATILRSGWRPPVEQLHQQALARIANEPVGIVLSVPGIPPVAAPRPPSRPGPPRPQAPDPLGSDPHAVISAAVQEGRHPDADALAAQHERAAVEIHGPGAEQALHWAEVRADLAMLAGDPVRSCRAWMLVALARLSAGQPVDAPEVEAAVDRAHHQWGQIRDVEEARRTGPALADLRSRVPGRRRGALDHVRRQLRQLQTQS
ncbi:hypothetical protein ABZT17_18975 [Streptomyces sp. NPDC005648]|uniref:hypothetical protein n=1 Tax=Streptomyces sp. NPDC005648 TaxID=3157044 RepID=UPI0033A4AE60